MDLSPRYLCLAVLAACAAGSLIDNGFAQRREQVASSCRAIDGDTLRCGSERIRLNAIDAPEMPGHCRPGRRCVVGDPVAARDHLAGLIRGKQLTIDRLKTDRYGRTVAQVWVDGLDLSCLQMDHVEYRRDWDEGGRTAGACE